MSNQIISIEIMRKCVFIKMVEKTMKNKAVLIHQTTSLKVKFTTVIKHYGIVITNYTGGTIITPRILNCVTTAYSSVSNENFVFNSNLDLIFSVPFLSQCLHSSISEPGWWRSGLESLSLKQNFTCSNPSHDIPKS